MATAVAGPSYHVTVSTILQPPLFDSGEMEVDAEIVDLPEFQRGAVEGPPMIDNSLDDPDVAHAEYGSQRFPLRDAVEALPANKIDFQVASLPLQESGESVVFLKNILRFISRAASFPALCASFAKNGSLFL